MSHRDWPHSSSEYHNQLYAATIKQIMPAVKACIPLPAKIHNKTKRVSDMKDLESLIPELCILVDAAEQQIQRPKRKDMEKSHYSGKTKRHTVKVQYTTNIHGDIIHKTRHSPGKIHDSTVFNKKHPKLRNTMPNGIPIQFTGYADRGYQGANDILGSLMMITPIKKKRGKKGEKRQKAHASTEGIQQNSLQDQNLRGACYP